MPLFEIDLISLAFGFKQKPSSGEKLIWKRERKFFVQYLKLKYGEYGWGQYGNP